MPRAGSHSQLRAGASPGPPRLELRPCWGEGSHPLRRGPCSTTVGGGSRLGGGRRGSWGWGWWLWGTEGVTHNPRGCAGHAGALCPPPQQQLLQLHGSFPHRPRDGARVRGLPPRPAGPRLPTGPGRCSPTLRSSPAHPGGAGGGGVVGKAEPQAGSIPNKAQCFWGSDCAEMSPPHLAEGRWCCKKVSPFPSSGVAELGGEGQSQERGVGVCVCCGTQRGTHQDVGLQAPCPPHSNMAVDAPPAWLPTDAEPTVPKPAPPPRTSPAKSLAWAVLPPQPPNEDPG